jgi:hypothetical protein
MPEIVKMSPTSVTGRSRVRLHPKYYREPARQIVDARGSLAQQLAAKTLGSCRTQVTTVTSDFESYTAFADLEQTVVGYRSTVIAVLRPTYVLGLGMVFVARNLEVLPIRDTPVMA